MILFNELDKQKVKISGEFDVIVCGAGPAGVAAAITSARNGAKTILVEQCGDVGGIATVGLMSHWTGQTQGGIYEEILKRSLDSEEETMRQTINPELLKTVLLEMLDEAGVDLLLYTFSSEAIMDGNTIKGVVIQNKSGRSALIGKILIDSTGDGDIAADAGAQYYKGRENDGKMQPVTIMFKVGGVDTQRAVFPGGFEDNYRIPKGMIQKLGKENLEFPMGHVLLYRSTLPNVVTCNMTNCLNVDGTDTQQLTKATIVLRKQIPFIVKFLREYIPGFEECFVISTSSLIGVRETRHFIGEQTITEQDIREAKVFDDWVVTKAHFNFDVHNMTGSGLDDSGVQKLFPQSKGYTIPYGCFVPKKIEGLLLAGRDISGTHMAHSNYRVMPICANMGQAVGSAASIAIKQCIMPRMVKVNEIQELLMKDGVAVE